MDTNMKKYPSVVRINGWSLPLNSLQILLWIAIFSTSLIFYFVCIPAFIEWLQYTNYSMFSVLLLFHLTVHIAAFSIDPAESRVIIKYKNGLGNISSKFDRSKHRHVIENCHCYICQIDVSEDAKHCSACNKCIARFDHHCRWLNNCIGRRNYRFFILTLFSAIVSCLWVAAFSLLLVIAFFSDKNQGKILKANRDYQEELNNSQITNPTTFKNTTTFKPHTISAINNETITSSKNIVNDLYNEPVWEVFFTKTHYQVLLSICGLEILLTIIPCGFVFHLFAFHCYLMNKKMTTYDYIIKQRNEEDDNEESSPSDCKNRKSSSSYDLTRNNKIHPNVEIFTIGPPIKSILDLNDNG